MPIINKLFIIFWTLFINSICLAQSSLDTIYLSYKNIHNISINNNSLYAVVDKGFIKIDLENEETFFYNRSNLNLPTDDIRSIEIDNDNNIWLCSYYNGLFKLKDGQIKHFTADNSKLPSSDIQLMEFGIDNILWLSTNKGIVKINNEELEVMPSSPRANSFYFESKDEFWCGTYSQGLWHYSKGIWKQFTPNNSYHINDFLIDKDSRKWVATDKGLFVFEGKGFERLVAKYLESQSVLDLEKTNSGEIWAATYSGLHHINGDSIMTYNKFNSEMTANYVFPIKADNKNNIWFGSKHLMQFSSIEKTITKVLKHESIPTNYIRKIEVSENNDIWLGTYHNGLIKYENGKWKDYTLSNFESLGDYIEHLFIDNDQNIWIASRNSETDKKNRLVKFDGKNWSSFPIKPDHFILDFKKRIWYVDDCQLYLYNTKRDTLTKIIFPINDFMAYSKSLSIDDKGDIWISSKSTGEKTKVGVRHDEYDNSEGIAKISKNDIQIYDTNIELKNILFSHKGEVFGLGHSGGIYKLNDEKWQYLTDCSCYVTCAEFDRNGTLWIGTLSSGLKYYNNDVLVNYIPEDCSQINDENAKPITIHDDYFQINDKNNKPVTYIPNNSLVLDEHIFDINVDENNNLWIGTVNGLTFLENKIKTHNER